MTEIIESVPILNRTVLQHFSQASPGGGGLDRAEWFVHPSNKSAFKTLLDAEISEQLGQLQ